MDAQHRATVEGNIAARLVEALVNETDLYLRVWDGEEWATDRTRNIRDIMEALGATDHDYIHCYTADPDNPIRRGWVMLVWGLGADVLADWTMGTEVDPIVSRVAGLEVA